MKKKKGGFLAESYRESFDYIRNSRNFIYSIIIVFLFFSLIGFFIPAPPALEAKILEFIEELLRKTEGLSQGELIRFIFLNNIQSSFIGMIFGIILGVFPILTTLANGYLLGFVAARTAEEAGIFILWRLLPHGIFELPALFISLGLGLKLGTFVFKKNKFQTLSLYLTKSIKVFFFIVLPLLIIAAIIEGSLISLLN
ncbi:MAG: stage II sporulation protein M [Nanoarchaeota archaeon]|nr:stage II sporulation protein M [Nanoarchaeota archaeon]